MVLLAETQGIPVQGKLALACHLLLEREKGDSSPWHRFIHKPSTFNSEQSALNTPTILSTLNPQQSTPNTQHYNLNPKPSAINTQHPTLNTTISAQTILSTLNPQQSTPNTQHYNLNPKPSAINTQHPTLNTTISALGPQLSTLSPELCTGLFEVFQEGMIRTKTGPRNSWRTCTSMTCG
jgi:hypothetical protein